MGPVGVRDGKYRGQAWLQQKGPFAGLGILEGGYYKTRSNIAWSILLCSKPSWPGAFPSSGFRILSHGTLRVCQHALLLGTLWGTLWPLSIIEWCVQSNRVPLRRTQEENALGLFLILLEEAHAGNQLSHCLMGPLCSLAGCLCMISVC